MWISRVNLLVDEVERWARDEGWSTRRIEKRLEDAWIGPHRVPALLMQEELCRGLLEPLGLSAHGSEGVVDLYLMPAYDDIAELSIETMIGAFTRMTLPVPRSHRAVLKQRRSRRRYSSRL